MIPIGSVGPNGVFGFGLLDEIGSPICDFRQWADLGVRWSVGKDQFGGHQERRLNLDTLPLSGVRSVFVKWQLPHHAAWGQNVHESLIMTAEAVTLPIVRPRIFLDTNICINVANGSIDPDEWRRVKRRITTNYRYCISVITLKELFSKLARGSDAYFDQNKGPLRVLDTPAKKTFLPYPHVFALRTVLRIMSAARNDCSGLAEEEWARTVLRAVLDAPSKRHLKHGIPIRNRKHRMQTFDLDHFDAHENQPQHEHVQLLQGVREGDG